MLNRSYMTGKCYHDGMEITRAEYAALFEESRTKAAYVDDLYAGRIAIGDVPTHWQEEIHRRVDERRQTAQEEEDLSAEEALDIILGGENV